jgi:hypothetical protein
MSITVAVDPSSRKISWRKGKGLTSAKRLPVKYMPPSLSSLSECQKATPGYPDPVNFLEEKTLWMDKLRF